MKAFAIRAFPTHIMINSDGTLASIQPGAISKDSLKSRLKALK